MSPVPVVPGVGVVEVVPVGERGVLVPFGSEVPLFSPDSAPARPFHQDPTHSQACAQRSGAAERTAAGAASAEDTTSIPARKPAATARRKLFIDIESSFLPFPS